MSVVPTMGALHSGHQALIREASRHGHEVVVTVFVNPTQFGPNEDFEKYPRDLDADLGAAGAAGAKLVFAPPVLEMYPAGETTRVLVAELGDGLCGARRPGHFEGVATVVAKLFNVCGAATYVFGRKDYQQLVIIERLAKDLLFPVRIVRHPIVREPDGLALSSRNVYLSAAERTAALSIPRALAAAAHAFAAGEREPRILLEAVRGALDRAGLVVDYVELVSPADLSSARELSALPERVLLAVAAFSGSTRLIDNLLLGEESAPELSR